MRFRAGLVIGFAAGYYAGAMAGRERYEQINQMLTRVKRSDTFEAATSKAQDIIDLGTGRAQDLVETTSASGGGSGTTGSQPATSPAMGQALASADGGSDQPS